MTARQHPADEHDIAWANFVAAIDPVALQREFARPGDLDAERFGSRQHHEMVHAHDWLKRNRAARAALTPDERRRLRNERQLANAEHAIALHPLPVTALERDDIEAAIRTYSQSKAATAAERKSAA